NSNYGERLNFPYVDPFCCGFHQPTQNLVNFFVVNDSGLPLAVTGAWNTRDTSFSANTTVPVDPRLDWTAGRDGVPYKDWGLHSKAFIRDRSYSGPYSPKKNVHEKRSGAQSAVGWNSFQLNSVHIHIYRYADVLLLLAEAAVETGNLEEARGIINQIRARAGAEPIRWTPTTRRLSGVANPGSERRHPSPAGIICIRSRRSRST